MLKKLLVPLTGFFSILFSLFFLSCPIDDDIVKEGGKILILQAYGTGNNSGGSVNSSFVELYNTSNRAVNLSGYSLYYADGTRLADLAGSDQDWEQIFLEGTIPSKGSFLIAGAEKNTASPRLKIESWDIKYDDFILSDSAFKVALVQSEDEIFVQNPFDVGSGNKVKGYVDMLGARTSYEYRIMGYETTPVLGINNSASARRLNLDDTDKNSTDFTAINYSLDGINDLELAAYRPRASIDGAWNPFRSIIEQPPEEDDNTLLILQIGAATNGSISRSFVELYNMGNKPVNMEGYSLQYATGYSVNSNWVPDPAAGPSSDGTWRVISLSGKTVMPRHSFLILGEAQATATEDYPPALDFLNNYGDINQSRFNLSNRTFKVALIKRTTALTVENPFNTGDGGKVPDYVDMVGAVNSPDEDMIRGYETSPLQNLSKQVSLRRRSLTDTDNNRLDFEAVRYSSFVKDMPDPEKFDLYRPKNHAYGPWDPFADIGTTKKLMILQVFGTPTTNDSAPSHSFIELYNNTDAEINLGTYSVHYANGKSSLHDSFSNWTKINLSGSIPAKGSYLILGKQMVDNATIANNSTTNGRLDLTKVTADINVPDFIMSNRSYKVALMSNQNNLFPSSPWGDSACIDLTSAINTGADASDPGMDAIDAAKGDADLAAVNSATAGSSTISKQKAWRRTSLVINNETLFDFRSISYRNIAEEDILIYSPRTTKDGSYRPQF